jgi:2-phospho-L-lactate transferase/gluconeogenesis factor (CofD/UPF0052 family)
MWLCFIRKKDVCMKNEEQNLITIGGGSGQFVSLYGLRDLNGITIAAVVSMVDRCENTGMLRDELGILPLGDVLE